MAFPGTAALADEWLPPGLPAAGDATRGALVLAAIPLGTPPRPRPSSAGPSAGSWDPQRHGALDDVGAAQAADGVYDSMDDLAAALRARLATRTDLPEFRAWRRSRPEFKPRLPGPS